MNTTETEAKLVNPWAHEFRATMAVAWPLILTNLTMMLINVTDVYLLGKLGPDALAASALGAGIMFTMLLFGIGLVIAAAPLMATEIGRDPDNVDAIRAIFRQSLWAALLITIPMWTVMWFTGPLLRLAGQPERLANDVALFMGSLQWMILPALGIVALRSFMAALERTGWTLVAGLAAVVFNAAINWVLIFGAFGIPALGLWGAGLGSTLTNIFQFGFLIFIANMHPVFGKYRLFESVFQKDWERLKPILRLGAPISLAMGFEASVFGFAVFLMGYIDTTSVAAHAIAIQIASVTFMVPMGMAQAATVRIGIGFGRKDPAMIGRAGWTAYVLGVGFMTLSAIILWLFPAQLAGLFIDVNIPGNAPVIALAVQFLALAALFQIADGAQVVGAGMLRGLHDTRTPMLYAAFGYWLVGIGVGSYLAFGAKWNGVGIWTGLATGLGFVAVLMLVRWLRRDELMARQVDAQLQI